MKRFSFVQPECGESGMVEDSGGKWMFHSDHASEVREKDELIQKLEDRLAVEVREAFYFTNDSRELEETDKRSSAAVVKVMESFGLRKVGGTWERCK